MFSKKTFLSIISCLLSFFIVLLYFIIKDITIYSSASFASVVLLVILFKFFLRVSSYQIFIRSFFLGIAFNVGVILASTELSYRLIGWYIAVLSFFHWSEYVVTSITNPRNLSIDSFLLDHSQEYHIAIASSFIEYILEWILLPSTFSTPSYASLVGLGLVMGGEVVRKGAMFNAGTNFNHQIRSRRESDHELVTSGLYAICRHPSYVGWFYWCLGSQLMILNPVCTVLYTLFTWFFFRERIIVEEYTLLSFFGESYTEYQLRVPTGIPFVSGYNSGVPR